MRVLDVATLAQWSKQHRLMILPGGPGRRH